MNKISNNIIAWEIKDIKNNKLSNLYVESILYKNFLEIVLKSETHKIRFKFERFISYRVSDEAYLLEYWTILESNTNNFTFSKIENSTFLNEISILSKDFLVDGGQEMIEHYAIFTENECIEIISDLHPIVLLTTH